MGGDLSRASNQKKTSHEPRYVTLTTDGPKSKSKQAPENGVNRFKIQFQISRILYLVPILIANCHITDFLLKKHQRPTNNEQRTDNRQQTTNSKQRWREWTKQ